MFLFLQSIVVYLYLISFENIHRIAIRCFIINDALSHTYIALRIKIVSVPITEMMKL